MTLTPNAHGNIGLQFAPEMGGFVVTDPQNTVLARYLLRDGALVRVPVTDFSILSDFWRELGYDWSPLSFAETTHPDGVEKREVLRWYYDRLNVFATGEAARILRAAFLRKSCAAICRESQNATACCLRFSV